MFLADLKAPPLPGPLLHFPEEREKTPSGLSSFTIIQWHWTLVLPVTELSADQKGLVRKVMADLLGPFRKADADEAMKLIEAAGFDNLHMAFYKNMDIGQDGVWDVWQIEGPSMVWYFRGAPHVHTWVNVREPEKA